MNKLYIDLSRQKNLVYFPANNKVFTIIKESSFGNEFTIYLSTIFIDDYKVIAKAQFFDFYKFEEYIKSLAIEHKLQLPT